MKSYSILETAKLLGVARITVKRWNQAGKIKDFRVGVRKDRRFSQAEIDRILERK